MKLEALMRGSSGVRNITQVVSEKLPFFFGRVLGGRLARGKSRKNHKCRKTTKYLVVVWREIHLGLVIFQPSVRGRLAREWFRFHFHFQDCKQDAKCREKLKNYKGRGLLDETSLVDLCLFYLMFCISVFSRFTFLHRYKYEFIYHQDFARISTYLGQTPWGMVCKIWILLRFRAYLVESGLSCLSLDILHL